MVLYHCITLYHFFEAIVHSALYHRDEKKTLLVPDFSLEKFSDPKKLEGFFDEVVTIPYWEIANKEECIIDSIKKTIRPRLPHNLNEYTEINVAGAHFYFSLLLLSEGIRFNYFEDGAGILSKPRVAYEILKQKNELQANVMQTYGMFDGDSVLIDSIYCNVKAQSYKLCSNKIIDFNPSKLLNERLPELKNKISNLYEIKSRGGLDEESVLVFAQQFSGLNMMSFEDHMLIYQLSVDFLLKNKKIVVKAHPDDVMFYEDVLKGCDVIRDRFPSELIELAFDTIPSTSFTCFSSSVYSIQHIFKKRIFCGYDYDKTFKRLDKYYFMLKLAESLDDCIDSFFSIGMDVMTIENLKDLYMARKRDVRYLELIHEVLREKSKSSLVLIDDLHFKSDFFRNKKMDSIVEYKETIVPGISKHLIKRNKTCDDDYKNTSLSKAGCIENELLSLMENLSNKDIIIFGNTQNDYIFFEKDKKSIYENLVPICINKHSLSDDAAGEEYFYIWVYTKSMEVKDKVRSFNETIELTNTGVYESSKKMTKEQERIAILEGMLEATEQRLKRYIEKDKPTGEGMA